MKYVVYYRVSTVKQGKSGLGLEAQRHLVNAFVKQDRRKVVIGEFKDVESGKKNYRPHLQEAIELCKKKDATLLIAKLDRLSRNASFIFTLRDNNVRFQALDIPEANTLTIGIFATIAQHEREIISQRTKDALNALKARGVRLGTPRNLTPLAQRKAVQSIKRNAITNRNNLQASAMISHLRKEGLSYQSIANRLNDLGYRTRYNNEFQAMSVQRLANKLE